MKPHYTEADLLETYYMQPGQSMPIMMHLAGCEECAERYHRLDRKLREAAACHTTRPESFWAAQRSAILARVGAVRPRRGAALARIAAAALLALVAGGLAMDRRQDPAPAPEAALQQLEERLPADPWESDELREFGSVVQWESWMAESTRNTEERSL